METRLFDAPAQADDEFGIYIHVPFCSHICPYCDFNTYAGQSARIPAYVEAIQRDAEQCGKQFDGRLASSIFLGGGTPSLLAPIRSRTSSTPVSPSSLWHREAKSRSRLIPTTSTKNTARLCLNQGESPQHRGADA